MTTDTITAPPTSASSSPPATPATPATSPVITGSAAIYLFWASLGWTVLGTTLATISLLWAVLLSGEGPAMQQSAVVALAGAAVTGGVALCNWRAFQRVKPTAQAEMRARYL